MGVSNGSSRKVLMVAYVGALPMHHLHIVQVTSRGGRQAGSEAGGKDGGREHQHQMNSGQNLRAGTSTISSTSNSPLLPP
jgi:hypothetical protein